MAPPRRRRCARRVYGPDLRAADGPRARRLHPDLATWVVETGYGRVLSRPGGLGARERELVTVAVLAATRRPRQLVSHLLGAAAWGGPPAIDAAVAAGLSAGGPRAIAARALAPPRRAGARGARARAVDRSRRPFLRCPDSCVPRTCPRPPCCERLLGPPDRAAPVTMGALAVVAPASLPAPGAPFDRLADPLTPSCVGPAPRSRASASRWPVVRRRGADRAGRAPSGAAAGGAGRRAARAPPPARRARRRRSRRLERLARGEAVCAVAGQQPAPLGGPLYSLHKTASTRRARRARRGAHRDPVRAAVLDARRGLRLRRDPLGRRSRTPRSRSTTSTLPDAVRIATAAGRRRSPAAPVAALDERRRSRAGRACPDGDAAAALLRAGVARGPRSRRGAQRARCSALFGERGAGGRRSAAAGVPRRGAPDHRPLPGARRGARRRRRAAPATRLEAAVGRRPLADPALDSFVFAIEDGARRKITVERGARRARAAMTLSPSVALRPAVQDGVFPTVAMACGPGEIAYLAQLREVFEGLGVRAAAVRCRASAPPGCRRAAVELIEASGADPWEVVAATDAVLRAERGARVPRGRARRARACARAERATALDRFAAASRARRRRACRRWSSRRAARSTTSSRGCSRASSARCATGSSASIPSGCALRYYLSPGRQAPGAPARLARAGRVPRRRRWRGSCATSPPSTPRRVERGAHDTIVLEL